MSFVHIFGIAWHPLLNRAILRVANFQTSLVAYTWTRTQGLGNLLLVGIVREISYLEHLDIKNHIWDTQIWYKGLVCL